MYLAGYTLDNLSLMALTVATGFVVDDAIVVLENVMRHMERGKTALRAALDGAREIGFTDRKSTRLNSSHLVISYAVFCLKKKKREPSSAVPCRTVSRPLRPISH